MYMDLPLFCLKQNNWAYDLTLTKDALNYIQYTSTNKLGSLILGNRNITTWRQVRTQELLVGYKKKFVNKLSSGKNAYRIITGAMTTWILMIAFEADHSVPSEIVLDLAIFATLLLVTYVFASIISEEIIVRRQTSWKRIFEIVLEVSPVLLSTVPPFFIFVIASFGIITVKTGLLLSDLSLLSILFLMGFLAGKAITGVSRGLLDGALAVSIGGCLVILRGLVI